MPDRTEALVRICDAADLAEGGKGVRFPVLAHGHATTGFVVRYNGMVYGYLNRCAHVPIELDWAQGEFFDSSGLYIMCSTHGAIYNPDDGHCVGGPCRGGRLPRLAVREADGVVYWLPEPEFRQVEEKSPTMTSIPIHPAGKEQ